MSAKTYSLVTATEALLIEREILRLLTTFTHRLDAGKFGEVAELFQHAEYGADGSKVEGRDAVESYLAGRGELRSDGTSRTFYTISNVAFEIDPLGDRASSTSYYTVHRCLGDSPLEPLCAGRYVDTFELHSGEWRFKSRTEMPMFSSAIQVEPPQALNG